MAFEDDLKKASELAQALKDVLGVKELPAIPETTQEMETGSPRTPGYDEHSGKTMKPAPQWPGDDVGSPPAPDHVPAPAPQWPGDDSSPEPSPDSPSPASETTEFDKALEAVLQQTQEHKESREHDKDKGLDR